MLVSIIVPIFNAEKYLPACIESILAQSYADFELILVNDGSTDKSLIVCEQYRQKDARVIVLDKKNGGSASAKNEGIRIANGDFIEFVDADDIIDKNYLENMLVGVGDTIDLCVGNMCFLTQKDGKTISERYVEIEAGHFSLCQFLSFYPKYMPQAIFGSPCNKLYKRSIICENKLEFDTTLRNNEDTRFNYLYIPLCKQVFVSSSPYYRYINRGESASTKYIENLFEIYVGTYLCARAFLKETNTYDQLIHFQNQYFLGLVIGAISSIVRRGTMLSPKEKIRKIKDIVNNEEVIFALSCVKIDGSARKMITSLMRLRAARLLYVLFLLK